MKYLKALSGLYKEHLNKIILSGIFSIGVAGSTSDPWLLDPAIKKIFIDKDQSLIFLIPALIILAFGVKGISLYVAKMLMINVGEEVKKKLQFDMLKSIINFDTNYIDKKHSGKYISNITYDVGYITNLLSTAVLNLFKDSFTLIGLLTVMFIQNWKLSLVSIIMIPIASYAARSLGKRMGKVSTQAQEKSGFLTTYLVELFKNHKLIKIFQKEDFETTRANYHLTNSKTKVKNCISPCENVTVEVLTNYDCSLIFYSGKLIMNNEIEVNNFFHFWLMMLAYQPVSLYQL